MPAVIVVVSALSLVICLVVGRSLSDRRGLILVAAAPIVWLLLDLFVSWTWVDLPHSGTTGGWLSLGRNLQLAAFALTLGRRSRSPVACVASSVSPIALTAAPPSPDTRYA